MNPQQPIKVLLIDNHPLVLDGLKALLETYSHVEVVGTAGLARAGLEVALRTQPDVVLMDINMPQVNGIDAIELFQQQLPGIRVLMLSMHDSREYISTSVLRGARGYILKDVSTEEIVAAIEAVARGETYFSSGVSDVLMERKPDENATPLTIREQEVLRLLAAGQSNRDIGQALGISAATVETHRKNLKKKLGIATTAGLTRYVIEHGLN
ncbi:DNA-binding response regulator, LuxR family (plasmid) [Sinorhizobium sojae CCBAU 05684]|uniref:DNA-binding response regulator, LuxR family n=1 Tax=Sinorhizobium sojae CCBAU 05684 TaxID=716928 RepID=A0A249PK57_9HYPH|nr:response regulator transcription factor [Sinorhizobium sojae]ASY66127.1 DNA-binding response regulator, LuxR family [Sinorhizobium sojae CCBAU 05684]